LRSNRTKTSFREETTTKRPEFSLQNKFELGKRSRMRSTRKVDLSIANSGM
jgi:hypothetical protein